MKAEPSQLIPGTLVANLELSNAILKILRK